MALNREKNGDSESPGTGRCKPLVSDPRLMAKNFRSTRVSQRWSILGGQLWLHCFFALLIGASIAPSLASGAQAQLTARDAEAALLFNFAKHVTWPEKALPKGATLTIAVLGENKFESKLDGFNGKVVKGHPIRVAKFRTPQDFTGAHILFCNISSIRELRSLIKNLKLKEKHVLTVGDYDGFARNGGIIQLTRRGERLAIEYNSKAAKDAKVFLSGTLVRLATRID